MICHLILLDPKITDRSSFQFIKNTLVKHGWNEERTRDELLKYDPESTDKSQFSAAFRPNYSAARPSNSGTRPGASNGSMVRIIRPGTNVPVLVRKPIASKGGHARRGSSGSEDDDYGVRKGKDDRVYDR